MATYLTQQPLLTISVPTTVDLFYTKRFVKMSSGNLVYAGDGDKAIGVLGAETSAGQTAPAIVQGVVLVEVGSGGITANSYVSSDASGKAVAVGSGDATNGLALDTASSGDLARILL